MIIRKSTDLPPSFLPLSNVSHELCQCVMQLLTLNASGTLKESLGLAHWLFVWMIVPDTAGEDRRT